MSTPSPVTDGATVWAMTGTGVLKAFDFKGTGALDARRPERLRTFRLELGLRFVAAPAPGVSVHPGPARDEDRRSVVCHEGRRSRAARRSGRSSGPPTRSRSRPTPTPRQYSSPPAKVSRLPSPAVTSPDTTRPPAKSCGARTASIPPTIPTTGLSRPGSSPTGSSSRRRATGRSLPSGRAARATSAPRTRRGASTSAPTCPRPSATATALCSPRQRRRARARREDRGGRLGDRAAQDRRLRLVAGARRWQVVCTSENEGLTSVFNAGPKFEVVAENSLDDYCLASPAVSNGQIFIRTDKFLWAIGKGRRQHLELRPQARRVTLPPPACRRYYRTRRLGRRMGRQSADRGGQFTCAFESACSACSRSSPCRAARHRMSSRRPSIPDARRSRVAAHGAMAGTATAARWGLQSRSASAARRPATPESSIRNGVRPRHA